MVWLVIACIVANLLLALIPGFVAKDKGYSFGVYYLLGVALIIPAVIVTLLMHPKGFIDAQERLVFRQLYDCGEISEQEYLDHKMQVATRNV